MFSFLLLFSDCLKRKWTPASRVPEEDDFQAWTSSHSHQQQQKLKEGILWCAMKSVIVTGIGAVLTDHGTYNAKTKRWIREEIWNGKLITITKREYLESEDEWLDCFNIFFFLFLHSKGTLDWHAMHRQQKNVFSASHSHSIAIFKLEVFNWTKYWRRLWIWGWSVPSRIFRESLSLSESLHEM